MRKMSYEFRAKLSSGEVEWKHAINFRNCIHDPLFDAPDDTCIPDFVTPLELHLILGLSNKILSLLNDEWLNLFGVEVFTSKWCDKNNIHHLEYRGKDLNGPY